MKHKPLIALCLGFFMVIMDVTIVNVALPNIKSNLDASVSWLQWVVDGYTLAFASFLLIAGYLGDKLDAKKLFQIGVILFIVTSLCCALSNVAWLLTFFRLLQGASAAFMVPTSITLINASFTDNQTSARAIGIWGAIGGIAAATGPFLGAILTATFNWRAVFFVNIPIGLICLLLTANHVVAPAMTKSKTDFDRIGQLFGMLSISALAFALIEAGRFGWTSFIFMSSIAVAIIALVIFIYTEYRLKHPMFPLLFFKNHHFTLAMSTGFIMTLAFYGELFLLPLYFHDVRGYSILMTGFAIVPLMVMVAFGSYLSGKIVAAIGPKWPIAGGFILGFIGFLGVLGTTQYNMPYWTLVFPFMILGFAISFIMPAATTMIVHAVPKGSIGIASGAFNTSRQIGSLIGVAIFGTIIATTSHFLQGMAITLWVAVGLFICMGVITAKIK